jgi:hypothetical protein
MSLRTGHGRSAFRQGNPEKLARFDRPARDLEAGFRIIGVPKTSSRFPLVI